MEKQFRDLTRREREVLALVGQGWTNQAIADYLGVTRDTIRYHLKQIHARLNTGGDRARLCEIYDASRLSDPRG